MSDPIFLLNVLMRWLHVASAVVGVGGTVMLRFVLLPVLSQLPNGDEILTAVRKPFKRLMHSAIGILLLTGFYNYMAVAMPAVRAAKEAGKEAMTAYNPVMGVKILLSLVLVGIAFALLAPVPSFHEKRKMWLSVNVVLGFGIILLAGYLRRLWALP